MFAREKFSHPHKKCFVLFPNHVGSLNPPPSEPSVLVGTQSRAHSLWGSASSLAYRPVSDSVTICNSPSPPLADIVLLGFPFRAFLKAFKTRLLGRGFHTHVKNVLFFSPTDVRSHTVTIIEMDYLSVYCLVVNSLFP